MPGTPTTLFHSGGREMGVVYVPVHFLDFQNLEKKFFGDIGDICVHLL